MGALLPPPPPPEEPDELGLDGAGALGVLDDFEVEDVELDLELELLEEEEEEYPAGKPLAKLLATLIKFC